MQLVPACFFLFLFSPRRDFLSTAFAGQTF